jgi:hypothetical protein
MDIFVIVGIDGNVEKVLGAYKDKKTAQDEILKRKPAAVKLDENNYELAAPGMFGMGEKKLHYQIKEFKVD